MITYARDDGESVIVMMLKNDAVITTLVNTHDD